MLSCGYCFTYVDLSHRYFGDHNIEGMFATLAPLHILLEDVSIQYYVSPLTTDRNRALKHCAKSPSPKPSVVTWRKQNSGVILIIAAMKSATLIKLGIYTIQCFGGLVDSSHNL